MSEEKSKDLTLQDLIDEKNKDNIITLEKKTNNNERFKTVSVEDIAGPTTTKTLQQVANDEFMNELDIAINRVKTEQFAPIIEEGKAIIMDKILEHEEEMAEASAAVKSKSEPD